MVLLYISCAHVMERSLHPDIVVFDYISSPVFTHTAWMTQFKDLVYFCSK